MEFKRLDKRKGSGAASIRSRYAYLIHLPDIDYFPETNEKGVRLEGDIVLKDGRTMIPVYLTNPSQEYSYDTQGADDEKTFRVKFTGTHPGTELEALEFSKNLIEESFLILIPSCDKNTPGKLLGQIENPMIFTSTHKAAKDGDKFTFSFEQRIGSEFIYFSYGGIISLPPGGDDPDIPVPPSPGFDPTKWARRDASNIDDDNVLLWREALRIYNEDRILTLGAITATTTTLTLDLHSSGVNSVLMSGVERSKTEGDDFTFAPVSAGKLKYVLLYALPDPQLFHIIEGVEGNEAIYPDLPPGAMLIKAVLISEFGALLEDADAGYKPLAEDPWRNIVINSNAAVNIIVASSPSASFNVLVGAGVTAPKIAAIKTKVKKNTRDGQEITFYNDSDTPVALLAGDYEETLVYTTFPFADNYEIKPRSFAKFKRKENKYHELAGGGSASFPEGAAPGDVLTEGTEGPEWSNRLTTAETAITAINNRTSSVVDKMLHYWDATAGKWLSSGVEWVSAGILKVKSVILTTNTGTALPDELGFDGVNVFFGNTKRKLAFKDEIFEHNVRGKRVEATVSGTYAIDLNAGSHFSLTATTATTISFANMILADETCSISMTVTGELLTMPSWLIRDNYSDDPKVDKKREYTIIIKKGGVSPSGRFNVINM
ncbi:hypothetical protein [Kaistella sp.]|uniref:hypothetical protein n=1 Tax=Kaistella sp. TaxID=2782235 RepID=UPI002F929B04